jgi:hypothetical protein
MQGHTRRLEVDGQASALSAARVHAQALLTGNGSGLAVGRSRDSPRLRAEFGGRRSNGV